MKAIGLFVLALAVLITSTSGAPPRVFDENTDRLPLECHAISEERVFTVHAGTQYAQDFPGRVFTFDQRVWEVAPCARVTVTFVNDDHIRHQWMVHGVYPTGVFVLEVSGPGEATGSFIVPGVPSTLLVHCGIEQHQQKGMKGEILVGGGAGDLPNIIGVSGIPASDLMEAAPAQASPSAGPLALVALGLAFLWGRGPQP